MNLSFSFIVHRALENGRDELYIYILFHLKFISKYQSIQFIVSIRAIHSFWEITVLCWWNMRFYILKWNYQWKSRTFSFCLPTFSLFVFIINKSLQVYYNMNGSFHPYAFFILGLGNHSHKLEGQQWGEKFCKQLKVLIAILIYIRRADGIFQSFCNAFCIPDCWLHVVDF